MSLLSFRRKKPTQRPPKMALCFVLTRAGNRPTDAAVAAALDAVFGRQCRLTEARDGIWALELKGADSAFLSFMPAPIPTGEAESAADNLFWPDGPEHAKHVAHIICTLAASDTAANGALLLSRLASAALVAFDGTGVYWGPGAIA